MLRQVILSNTIKLITSKLTGSVNIEMLDWLTSGSRSIRCLTSMLLKGPQKPAASASSTYIITASLYSCTTCHINGKSVFGGEDLFFLIIKVSLKAVRQVTLGV